MERFFGNRGMCVVMIKSVSNVSKTIQIKAEERSYWSSIVLLLQKIVS